MEKIQFLSRKGLDAKAWDIAIRRSPEGLPYAYSWYLDAVAGNQWSALVAGDYQWVMPLPWNRKLLGIRQVYQPAFCQQLGVFGGEIDPTIWLAFVEAIPASFRYVRLHLHDYGGMAFAKKTSNGWRPRTNYVLSLDAPFEEIKKSFSKSLGKRLRKAERQLDFTCEGSPEELISFYRKELESKVPLAPASYQYLPQLFHQLLDREMAKIYQVRNGAGEKVAMGIFPETAQRIINLFGASNDQGRALFGMHFLLAKVIESHSQQNLLFDFEGSEVPGVAEFFASFGPQDQPYWEYTRNTLPTPLRLLQGLRHRL